MKSIFFSAAIVIAAVSLTGCAEPSPDVIEGINESEIEKYNRMVAESDASMSEGDKAMAEEGSR